MTTSEQNLMEKVRQSKIEIRAGIATVLENMLLRKGFTNDEISRFGIKYDSNFQDIITYDGEPIWLGGVCELDGKFKGVIEHDIEHGIQPMNIDRLREIAEPRSEEAISKAEERKRKRNEMPNDDTIKKITKLVWQWNHYMSQTFGDIDNKEDCLSYIKNHWND